MFLESVLVPPIDGDNKYVLWNLNRYHSQCEYTITFLFHLFRIVCISSFSYCIYFIFFVLYVFHLFLIVCHLLVCHLLIHISWLSSFSFLASNIVGFIFHRFTYYFLFRYLFSYFFYCLYIYTF